MNIDSKRLGGGMLHTFRPHVCDRPTADAARAAGGDDGSTWTCDSCRKSYTLRRGRRAHSELYCWGWVG